MALKILAVAFNNSIVDELKARLPEGIDVMTVHSLGKRMCEAAWGKVTIDDKGSKVFNICKNIIEETEQFDLIEHMPIIKPVQSLISMIKATLSIPSDDVFDDLTEKYGIDVNGRKPDIYEMTMRAFEKSISIVNIIDFDDMIYLPLIKELPCQTYDIVMADEYQDFSAARQQLIVKVAGDDGRLVLVGDENQAIYSFTGADCDSMQTGTTICENRSGVVILPLTQTRRCPKAIVELANEYVPDFYAMDDAPEGEVLDLTFDQAFGG